MNACASRMAEPADHALSAVMTLCKPHSNADHIHQSSCLRVQLGLSVLCLVGVPLAMFTVQALKEDQLSASWTMPFLPMLVLVISGIHPGRAPAPPQCWHHHLGILCLLGSWPGAVPQPSGDALAPPDHA